MLALDHSATIYCCLDLLQSVAIYRSDDKRLFVD